MDFGVLLDLDLAVEWFCLRSSLTDEGRIINLDLTTFVFARPDPFSILHSHTPHQPLGELISHRNSFLRETVTLPHGTHRSQADDRSG